MGQQCVKQCKSNKNDAQTELEKSRNTRDDSVNMDVHGEDLTGKISAQTIKNLPPQAVQQEISPDESPQTDGDLYKSISESQKSKKSYKSFMKKKKVRRGSNNSTGKNESFSKKRDQSRTDVQQVQGDLVESTIDPPVLDTGAGRQSEILMQKTESPQNKMIVGSMGSDFQMPNGLVDSIHHGEAAENAEFNNSSIRGSGITNGSIILEENDNVLNARGVQRPPAQLEEESVDDETIKRIDDDQDDITFKSNFQHNVEIGGRLNRNNTEMQFTTNQQAANQRNRQLTQATKSNTQQQDDMQSQGSYMVKVDSHQLPDDMQSTGSYMVKVGNDSNKRGPQPFDDVTSSGSYMVRGANNNLPDDMQSTGSYMVKVGGNGPKQFDDMSSQGSYMVKANDNNFGKMNNSGLQFRDDESQMVKGFDDDQSGFGEQNNLDIDVASSGTFMGNQTQEDIQKLDRNDTTLQIGNNNLTQNIEFDDVESQDAKKGMNKSSTEMVIGQ